MNLKIQIILFFSVITIIALLLNAYATAVLNTIYGFISFKYVAGDKVMTYFVDKYIP